MTKFDDLEKLADLKNIGILTEEEFEVQKKKLLETTERVQDEVSDENVDTSPLGRYVGCFKKYATFHGRASRSEFWWFFLFNFLAAIIMSFIPFIGGLYFWVSLIPSLAVLVRRLHDVNRSGWWVFWGTMGVILLLCFGGVFWGSLMMPMGFSISGFNIAFMLYFFYIVLFFLLVFSIILLILGCLPGTNGENNYGKKPV